MVVYIVKGYYTDQRTFYNQGIHEKGSTEKPYGHSKTYKYRQSLVFGSHFYIDWLYRIPHGKELNEMLPTGYYVFLY